MVARSINEVMESLVDREEPLVDRCRRAEYYLLPNIGRSLCRMAIQSRPLQRPLVMIMCRSLRTIGPDATLLEAAWLMRDAKVGALLVEEAGYYSGLISESDLVRRGMAESRPAHETLVRAVMSRPLLSIDCASSAHEASEKMAEHGIRHLAVSEEGQIVGIISVRDLLRYFKNWGDV
jgi:signal-transduction protein with cAMP-binding, CBS, and nucleotidyltransferase domain